jgi:hypothetical protein
MTIDGEKIVLSPKLLTPDDLEPAKVPKDSVKEIIEAIEGIKYVMEQQNEVMKEIVTLLIKQMDDEQKIRHNSDISGTAEDTDYLSFQTYKKGILIKGNTLAYKKELKEIGGGSWNRSLKGWMVTPTMAQKVIAHFQEKGSPRLEVESGI